MFRFIGLCLGTLVRLLRARRSLLLENLALRQQLAVLKRRHPRTRLDLLDKLVWVAVRRFWSGWQQSVIAVTPETVVRWHRGGFRLYWKLISKVRRTVGRRPTSKQVRELIFRMVVENPTWGAPRIHGELLMLSFDVSERTISGWMKRAPRDPESATRWLTFLRNHREAIAAMGFFTVPTITFSALYCFFATETQERDDDSSGAGEGADWSNGRWRRSRSAMQRRNERPKSGKWTPVRLRIELQPDCWFVREAHRYGRVEPMRPVRF
jgi:hypothetical protein